MRGKLTFSFQRRKFPFLVWRASSPHRFHFDSPARRFFATFSKAIAMWRFIFKRLLHMIPLLIGVSLLTFLLMSLAPGDYFTALQQNPQISPDTIAKLKAQFHLDKPWYVQYFFWLI